MREEVTLFCCLRGLLGRRRRRCPPIGTSALSSLIRPRGRSESGPADPRGLPHSTCSLLSCPSRSFVGSGRSHPTISPPRLRDLSLLTPCPRAQMAAASARFNSVVLLFSMLTLYCCCNCSWRIREGSSRKHEMSLERAAGHVNDRTLSFSDLLRATGGCGRFQFRVFCGRSPDAPAWDAAGKAAKALQGWCLNCVLWLLCL